MNLEESQRDMKKRVRRVVEDEDKREERMKRDRDEDERSKK
jgi:hypothetical protein